MALTLPATGEKVATDEVSDAHLQRFKIDAGGTGVSVPIEAGQQTKANSLPVVPASDIPDDTYIGGTKDAGPFWTTAYLHTASADATGGVDVTAAPTAGQKIVVDDIIASTDTDMKITFEEETSGTDVVVVYMAANGVAQVTPRGKIKLATADKKLRAVASAAGNIAVTVVYHSEA